MKNKLFLIITSLICISCAKNNPTVVPEEEHHPITSTVSRFIEVAVTTTQAESGTDTESIATNTLTQHNFLLPNKRIIAYYGNPLSKSMGVLGQYPNSQMIQMLNNEVAKWTKADPMHPAIPALHLIAVVAQSNPGKAGKYRMIMPDNIVESVLQLARKNNALLFIDIQTGTDDIRNILPKFAWLLKESDVHLGIDPEFNLINSNALPGKKVGTYDAKDINYVSNYLESIIQENNLPPKVVIIHRFTKNGVTNIPAIRKYPNIQLVLDMDGWGGQSLKVNTYNQFIAKESIEFTGFKLFYHNDTKKGDKLMTPQDVLKLQPQPIYIQYQ